MAPLPGPSGECHWFEGFALNSLLYQSPVVVTEFGVAGFAPRKYFTKARDLQKKEDLDLSVEPESGA